MSLRAYTAIGDPRSMVAVVRAMLLVGLLGLFATANAQPSQTQSQQAIQDLKSNPNDRIRIAAALELSKSTHPQARPALEQALTSDTSTMVRRVCALVLGHRGDKAALPALRARRDKESDADVRAAIDRAIAELTSTAPHAQAPQTHVPRRPPGIRDEQALRELESDPSDRVRVVAVLVLRDSGHRDARAALEAALARDPSSAVRKLCAVALGRRGDATALPALRLRYASEGDADVRAAIMAAIQRLGG